MPSQLPVVSCPLQRTTDRKSPIPNPLARFPLLNARPPFAIVEGMSDNPKTRRTGGNPAAAAKGRARKRPAAKRRKTPRREPVPNVSGTLRVPPPASGYPNGTPTIAARRCPVPDTLAPHQILGGAQSPGCLPRMKGAGRTKELEICKSDDQHSHPALALLAARPGATSIIRQPAAERRNSNRQGWSAAQPLVASRNQ